MSIHDEFDTIVAISTPIGEGGIGIVRLSGTKAKDIADKLFHPQNKSLQLSTQPTHLATYGAVYDAEGLFVDEVIAIGMWKPHSYTTEDIVEIQAHGGMMVLRKILELCVNYGARIAEPGEFTKRAFLNGRIDLSKAQSVMDIIQAHSESSLRVAANNLQGKLADTIQKMRHNILKVVAHLEASIDFPEEDIEDIAKDEALHTIIELEEKLHQLINTFDTGRILRDGLLTVIIGKPNVGKSSLLNNLLREERAIVTDIPGTTRDSLEEWVNLEGIPLRIVDTAGIRKTEDTVEKMGVNKAREYIDKADLILALFDLSRPLDQEDMEIIELIRGRADIIVLTKNDLEISLDVALLKEQLEGNFTYLEISNLHDATKIVADEIQRRVYQNNTVTSESVCINNIRQKKALEQALASVHECKNALQLGMPEDFIVIDAKNIWLKLGEVTGETINDDILDQIFSQFCIGK